MGEVPPFGSQFNQIIEEHRGEADAFYQAITPARVGEDAARVMRQALAGMLWSKQYFFYDTDKWLDEHGADPTRPSDPGAAVVAFAPPVLIPRFARDSLLEEAGIRTVGPRLR